MTARHRKAEQRVAIEERERAGRVAAFRSGAWRRLRSARLYEIGASELGQLSAAGREAWIRHTSRALPSGTDEDARLSAALSGAQLVPAQDGSAWVPRRDKP